MIGRFSQLFTLLVFAVALISCSGGTSPVQVDSQAGNLTGQVIPGEMNRTMWGQWQVTINTETAETDIIPMRTAQFTANVNNLLEGGPGNLLIQDMDLTNYLSEGRVDCTITLRHPLPGIDQYHGFDVWGVFMHNGSTSLDYDGLVYSSGVEDDEAMLLNADGYTRWHNYTEFNGNSVPILEYYPGKLGDILDPTATLNPYKIFADGLEAEEDYYEWITGGDNADNRGMFGAGQVNSRRYELQFPMPGGMPVLHFQYAVIATWEPGDPSLTGNPDIYEAGDFPSSANCDEAFFTNADSTASDLYYVDATQNGGSFSAAIEIFDWQGGSVSGNGVVNEISRLILEGDFLPGGTYEMDTVALASVASAGTVNSSVFQVDITGCTPSESGDVPYWVIVESAGLLGDSYDQGFPTEYPDGARRASFFQTLVNISNEPPAGFEVTAIDPDSVPFWGSLDDAEITGNDFVDGCTVELRQDTTVITGTDVQFINGGLVTADFDFVGYNSGLYDVVVINPGPVEGILEDGFAVLQWSDEISVAEGNYRLPTAVEMSSGPLMMAMGQNNGTMQYMQFDTTGGGWDGPWLLYSNGGNNMITAITADPNDDYVFYMTTPQILCRWDTSVGTGTWPTGWHGIYGNRTVINVVDHLGRLHYINNTANSFGFITHSMTSVWPPTGISSYELYHQYYPEAVNSLYLSEGNSLAFDSDDNMQSIYCKDNSLSPYLGYPPAGPRYIRVTPYPDSYAVSYSQTTVESVSGADIALDSPAITISSDDVIHVAYRAWDTSQSQWEIRYEYSTNGGSSYVPGPDIWTGANEPEEGFVFLYADSTDVLHAMYFVNGQFELKSSDDGTSWSDAEIVDVDLPVGDDDFQPKVNITSDDILHFLWVRGTASSGYGDVVHRMKDLI